MHRACPNATGLDLSFLSPLYVMCLDDYSFLVGRSFQNFQDGLNIWFCGALLIGYMWMVLTDVLLLYSLMLWSVNDKVVWTKDQLWRWGVDIARIASFSRDMANCWLTLVVQFFLQTLFILFTFKPYLNIFYLQGHVQICVEFLCLIWWSWHACHDFSPSLFELSH